MAQMSKFPINIPALNKRQRGIKRMKLSSLAKKNPNFKLAAY